MNPRGRKRELLRKCEVRAAYKNNDSNLAKDHYSKEQSSLEHSAPPLRGTMQRYDSGYASSGGEWRTTQSNKIRVSF